MNKNKTLNLIMANISEVGMYYMPFIKGGGWFVATDVSFQLGEAVSLKLQFLNELHEALLTGKIVWITPRYAHGQQVAGVGIQLTSAHASEINKKIEPYLQNIIATEHAAVWM